MLLHSLKAKIGDMRARGKMIESARALAELCPLIQGMRGLKPIHASLLLAVRVFLLCCCCSSFDRSGADLTLSEFILVHALGLSLTRAHAHASCT